MDNNAAAFVGSIPEHYDRGLGPLIFVDYAADMARRAAAGNPSRVLETAAGTGIVTRALRDALPADTALTATDLN
jgi:ubiquinone/menaquinone biosynthesis C-methylase UbiE